MCAEVGPEAFLCFVMSQTCFLPAGVRGGAVSERLQSVRLGHRALERVESQQRGSEGELWGRSPD